MTKSRKLIFGCTAFLAGIALFEYWPIPKWPFIFAAVFLLASFLFGRRFIFLLIALFIAGDFWAGLFAPEIDSAHIAHYNGKEKTFLARVDDATDSRIRSQYLIVKPLNYRGKALLKTNLYPEYEYGDLLEINCQLQAPNSSENFKYDDYLARFGVYSICERPGIKKLDGGQGNFFTAKILRFRNFAVGKLNETLSEPAAALLAGILIGERSGLPSGLSKNFQTVGLSHIIAISGFNITIIVMILSNLAQHFFISRQRAFWIILCFLFVFVVLTGISASVTRAAIMGGLVLFAGYIGRPKQLLNILVLAATIMVAFNPKILLFDLGFQLSFLSMLGLVFLSPRLSAKMNWLPKTFAIRENVGSTLAAIIFTMPLILFNFHRLSIVSPLVNVLVLPFIPLIMLFGFFQFIFSSIILFFGQVIGWFSWLLLSYIIKIAELFSKIPGAAVEIKIGFWLMLAIYGALIFVIFRGWRTFAKSR